VSLFTRLFKTFSHKRFDLTQGVVWLRCDLCFVLGVTLVTFGKLAVCEIFRRIPLRASLIQRFGFIVSCPLYDADVVESGFFAIGWLHGRAFISHAVYSVF
jgi:hypothetical protein